MSLFPIKLFTDNSQYTIHNSAYSGFSPITLLTQYINIQTDSLFLVNNRIVSNIIKEQQLRCNEGNNINNICFSMPITLKYDETYDKYTILTEYGTSLITAVVHLSSLWSNKNLNNGIVVPIYVMVIKKEIQRGKISGDINDIVVKIMREFYRIMWSRRSFWEPTLKAVK